MLQLETAMGAAIGAIEGARAVLVPRTRFAPVKTTDDLLLVRSDAYVLDERATTRPHSTARRRWSRWIRVYKSLAELERRFPHGPPSLRDARSLTVKGDVTFGAGVSRRRRASGPAIVADGCIIEP